MLTSDLVHAIDDDPFSLALLDDPYPFYRRLREDASVAFLRAHDCFAVGRHDLVQEVMSTWADYSSAAGVGLANFRRETPWRPPSIILEADPPLHTRTRAVLMRALSPGAIKLLRARFEAEADALIDRLVAQRDIDAVRDLAEVYPVKVFPDALGLAAEGRENLLPYGTMVFNSFGPRNAIAAASLENLAPVRDWIMQSCMREALSDDGIGAQIYAAADAGELEPHEAPLLIRSFLSAGVDTTVGALSTALWCLAANPDQWALLRADPGLARNAFEEAVRFETPTQVFFRTTTRDVTLGGVSIPDNSKVAAFLGAANRDPRRWDEPDAYRITRRAAGHAGLGFGIHGCVGQSIARLEGESILSALARKAARITLTGAPQRRYINVLRGFASLPMRLEPAAG